MVNTNYVLLQANPQGNFYYDNPKCILECFYE